MRRLIILALIILVAAAALLVFPIAKLSGHKQEIRAYFQDARGLRAGAHVRLAGVEVGEVESVRVRPELRDNAAEVVMTVRTPYELKIPSDSVVFLRQNGVLGETFPDIDIHNASGPPLANGGVLKTGASEDTAKEFLEKVSDIIQRKPCEPQTDGDIAKHQPSGGKSKSPSK